MTTVTVDPNNVTLDAFKQDFTEAIKAGVVSGDLAFEAADVTAKASDTDKTGKMPYQRVVAKTMNGILILAGGSQDELLKVVTAQFDAPVRANVRNAILREIEGPEKVLRSIAKKIATKYGKDADEVFAQLQANPALIDILT